MSTAVMSWKTRLSRPSLSFATSGSSVSAYAPPPFVPALRSIPVHDAADGDRALEAVVQGEGEGLAEQVGDRGRGGRCRGPHLEREQLGEGDPAFEGAHLQVRTGDLQVLEQRHSG